MANIQEFDTPNFPMSSSRSWKDSGWEKHVCGATGAVTNSTFYLYIKRIDHRTVAIKIPKWSWTSTAGALLTTGTAIPAKYRPVVDRYIAGLYADCDSNGIHAFCKVLTTGLIEFAASAVQATYGAHAGTWTNAKDAIIYSTILIYDTELDT